MINIVRIVTIIAVTTLSAHAGTSMYWRVVSSGTNTILHVDNSGQMLWESSSTGQFEQIQQARSLDPHDWQGHTLILATSSFVSIRVFDPNPPTGMVMIPSGYFEMGPATNKLPSNEDIPQQRLQRMVYTSSFYIEQHEVTLSQWNAIVTWASTNGYDATYWGAQGADTSHPVTAISWYSAVKWCNARSQKANLVPVYYEDDQFTRPYTNGWMNPFADWSANGYRLPTEAEWEKAARGGALGHRFAWSGSDDIQHVRANYFSRTNEVYDTSPTRGYHPLYTNTHAFIYTSPGGSFPANGYGLYDMIGNVDNWCWDQFVFYTNAYYSSSASLFDPTGPTNGGARIKRGGSYNSHARFSRVSYRNAQNPGIAGYGTGLRCVMKRGTGK